MKSCINILYIVFLSIACLTTNAQPSQYNVLRSLSKAKVRDSAYLRITYSLSYISDSLKSDQVWEDRKILLIGDSIQHFYSEYQRHSDSVATVSWEKGKPSSGAKFSAKIKYEGYDIYTYPVKGERIVLEYITNLSLYKYMEDIEKPQWLLSPDTCTILSYLCQKATAFFRGRDWEVWFALDIPIDAGPWKLYGLPGLIMKASDSREHYVFNCSGLENISSKKQPIIIFQATSGDFIECIRQEYLKAQRRFYENYVNALLSIGYNIYVYDDSGKQIDALETPNTKFSDRNMSWSLSIDARDRYRKIPYNPIELE